MRVLGSSLEAYREGDIRAALDRLPADNELRSDAAELYLAGLLLAVGEVEQTVRLLDGLGIRNSGDRLVRLAGAPSATPR